MRGEEEEVGGDACGAGEGTGGDVVVGGEEEPAGRMTGESRAGGREGRGAFTSSSTSFNDPDEVGDTSDGRAEAAKGMAMGMIASVAVTAAEAASRRGDAAREDEVDDVTDASGCVVRMCSSASHVVSLSRCGSEAEWQRRRVSYGWGMEKDECDECTTVVCAVVWERREEDGLWGVWWGCGRGVVKEGLVGKEGWVAAELEEGKEEDEERLRWRGGWGWW